MRLNIISIPGIGRRLMKALTKPLPDAQEEPQETKSETVAVPVYEYDPDRKPEAPRDE